MSEQEKKMDKAVEALKEALKKKREKEEQEAKEKKRKDDEDDDTFRNTVIAMGVMGMI